MIKNFKNPIKFGFPLMLVLTTMNAHALEWLIEGGFRSGGDSAISITDNNRNDFSLEAGGGLYLGFGFSSPLTSELKLRSTIGLVINNLSGTEIVSNSTFDYVWSHIPLDFLVIKETEKWIFGAGLTWHIKPELKGSGYFSGRGTQYNNTMGVIGEIDYRFAKDFFVSLNYTLINYKGNDGQSISATGPGMNVGFTF